MPRATVQSKGQAIHALRLRCGLTQEELAARSGYSKRTIERLESGTGTTLLTLSNLATVLRCSTDDLVHIEGGDTSEIRLRLKSVIERRQEFLKKHLERKRVAASARNASLSRLICSPREGAGIEITCRSTEKGDIPLRLMGGVTVGELANAIGKEYFKDEYDSYDWGLCDETRTLYDIALTASDLSSHLVVLVYLCKSKRAQIVLAAIPRQPWCLEDELVRLREGRYFFKALMCQIFLWFYNLPGFSRFTPWKWVVNQINTMAYLYAEANVQIAQALKLVKLMERNSISEWWPYRDTIAWTWYRSGHYETALAALAHDLPDEAFEDIGLICHLYFICRRIGDSPTAEAAREFFAAQQSVIECDPPASASANAQWGLVWKRISADDDTLVIRQHSNRVEKRWERESPEKKVGTWKEQIRMHFRGLSLAIFSVAFLSTAYSWSSPGAARWQFVAITLTVGVVVGLDFMHSIFDQGEYGSAFVSYRTSKATVKLKVLLLGVAAIWLILLMAYWLWYPHPARDELIPWENASRLSQSTSKNRLCIGIRVYPTDQSLLK